MGARFLRIAGLILLLAPPLLHSEARAETETELIHRRATLTLRQQEKIAKALAGQKSLLESWREGRSDGRHLRSSAVRSIQSAIEGCWAVELKMAEFRCEAISQAYQRKCEELSAERERRLHALGRRHARGSAESDLREARIETAIAQKEEACVAQILERYLHAAKDLARRRAQLCRETWRWNSFFENLNREDEAKAFRVFVFSQFSVGLADRSVGLHKELFSYHTTRDSRLDQFLGDLSHPEPIDRSDRMDSMLRRDRVETLKTEDRTEPPVSLEGSPLEKLIHALSGQLDEMFRLREAQKSLTAQLAELKAASGHAALGAEERATIEREISYTSRRLAANDGRLAKITAHVARLRAAATTVVGLSLRQLGVAPDFRGKSVDEIGEELGGAQERLIARFAAGSKDFGKDPAQHMYTFDELKREGILDEDRDVRTLTKILQITRLCQLIHGRQPAEARDKPQD